MNENTTDDIQSVQGTTPDFKTEFAKQLSELAPELVTDGKIDSKKLQELLDGDEADDSERFGLFWPGKKRAMRAAQEPTTATLKPVKEESKDWDTTQNLFIEGDNLEVLKVLQKHYHNKIKMIYIDPPYNTGKDFVYPDNYKEGLASYLEFTNQVDTEGRKVSTNSDTDGRYHSNWLNMMYPRIKLARNLLNDEGVIFISISDHEVDNLKKICNEIFGEYNFVSQLVWQNRVSPANDAKWFSGDHEYILVYARKKDSWYPNRLERTEKQNSYYKNPDNDPRGPWNSAAYTCNKNSDERPNLYYAITNPITGEEIWPKKTAVWAYSRETHEENVKANLLYWGSDGKSRSPRKKQFIQDAKRVVPRSVLNYSEVGSTQQSTLDFLKLFDSNYVQYTKPRDLISRLIQYGSNEDDIVLDLFSGSGTTAHSVMELNAKIGSNRKHIQVQLPEPTEENTDANRDGYKTIADIAKERIRRAGEKIKADFADKISERKESFDAGFRVYRLAESNFTKWQSQSDTNQDSLQQHLLDIRESSNDAATEEDLLTEVLLKQGISLTAPIFHADVAGLSVWTVGDNLVCAYLNEKQRPNLDQLRAIAANEPAKLIVLEDAFQGDDELKTNLHQICKSQKIELWTV